MTIPRLAKAELAVMELLWIEGRLTALRIRERLYNDADRPQHGTVQQLLRRLEEKGFVTRERSAPAHHFSARISREAYAGSQLESIARLTGGSLAPLISSLIDQKKLSRPEIERLWRLLDEHMDTGAGG